MDHCISMAKPMCSSLLAVETDEDSAHPMCTASTVATDDLVQTSRSDQPTPGANDTVSIGTEEPNTVDHRSPQVNSPSSRFTAPAYVTANECNNEGITGSSDDQIDAVDRSAKRNISDAEMSPSHSLKLGASVVPLVSTAFTNDNVVAGIDRDQNRLSQGRLEDIRAQMAAEFDVQRAALMQMFVAKEDELRAEQEKNFALVKQIEEFIGPSGLDLDESMRNAHKQTVLLRSVVKPMEDEIETYKQQLADVEAKLSRLQTERDAVSESDERLKADKAELARRVGDATAETRRLAAKIEVNESLLASLSVQLSGTDATLRAELQQLDAQLQQVEWQNRRLAEDNDRLLAKHCARRMEQPMLLAPTELASGRHRLHSSGNTGVGAGGDAVGEGNCTSGGGTGSLGSDDPGIIDVGGLRLPDAFEKAARLVEHHSSLADAFQSLEFEYLRLHEKMMESSVGWESDGERLRAELTSVREQLRAAVEERRLLDNKMSTEISQRDAELSRLRDVEHELTAARQRLGDYEAAEPTRQQLEKDCQELRCKVVALQKDLDNSEAVQKDFVKLSQSLQVQLEKLRVCDGEVRFQHADDIIECNNCRRSLPATSGNSGVGGSRHKPNCSHCGRIFCPPCVSKTIQSGPNRRNFNVCAVCHTLLDQKSAPFFSTQ